MEAKKISFGFSKINKKLNIIAKKETSKPESKVELIKCLEGQEIKLVEEKPEEKPLVIPLKENQKTSTALASLIKRRAVLLGEDEVGPNDTTDDKKEKTNDLNNIDAGEDLEKRAAQELLAEVQSNGLTDTASTLVLPVVKPDDLPLEGAKEATLDDYDDIPVQDFGKAMLRGMGWVEPSKTNKKGAPPLDETPMVRPKGMGLGADKALNKKPLLVAPEANEVLEIKRNAYVRILGGKHKDLYGQIEGFDDHAGRVIVKMAIGGHKEAFNEFLCQPVSRKEYAQYGKCINSTKYEEYKKKENKYGQIILNDNENDSIGESYATKSEEILKTKSKSSDEKKHVKKEYERASECYDGENNRERDTEYRRNREGKSYDTNYSKRYDDRDRRKEDSREHRRDYRNDDRSERYDSRTDRSESRNDYYRGREHNSQRNYKDYSETSQKDRQRDRNEDTYDADRNKRNDTSKVIDLNSSSSESQDETAVLPSKYKKSKKKCSKLKSKKSKRCKPSKRENSTESDSSDSDIPEAKLKRHKKHSKQNKKQRYRSRSRSRSCSRSRSRGRRK